MTQNADSGRVLEEVMAANPDRYCVCKTTLGYLCPVPGHQDSGEAENA